MRPAEQPFFQAIALGGAFISAFEQLEPSFLLLLRRHGQQANGLRTNPILAIGGQDRRMQIAQGQPLGDHALGDA